MYFYWKISYFGNFLYTGPGQPGGPRLYLRGRLPLPHAGYGPESFLYNSRGLDLISLLVKYYVPLGHINNVKNNRTNIKLSNVTIEASMNEPCSTLEECKSNTTF